MSQDKRPKTPTIDESRLAALDELLDDICWHLKWCEHTSKGSSDSSVKAIGDMLAARAKG